MSKESKDQIPPRTPVDVKFRNTGSKFQVGGLRPESATSSNLSGTV